MTQLCPGCFETSYSDSESCPGCGWSSIQKGRGIHLEPGQELHNRYILGRVLGQGGFGITYLGFDDTLKTKVAVKEYLYTEWASRQFGTTIVQAHTGKEADFTSGVKSFLDEARKLAHFKQHPNIVTVTDFFDANGTGYLVMDYVPGMTFKQYLALQPGGTLPWREALPIIIQVMDALRTAHTINLIHRDISPDNIYLEMSPQDMKAETSKNGGFIRALLLDFGNARHFDTDKSRSFSAVLKEGYAPPEQYSRKGKQGPWTDVYALGATFYKALTGITPPQALDRQHEDDLTPIATLIPDLPLVLVQILEKALELKTNDRYQTINEMLQPLISLLSNTDSPSKSPPVDYSKGGEQTVMVDESELFPHSAFSQPSSSENPHKKNDRIPVIDVLRKQGVKAAIGFSIIVALSINYPVLKNHFFTSDGNNSKNIVVKRSNPENPPSVSIPKSKLTTNTEPEDAKIEIVEPTLATLTVIRKPSEAKVTFVKTPDGSKPEYQDGIKLKPGYYQIEISYEGYKTEKKQLELKASQHETLPMNLTEQNKEVAKQVQIAKKGGDVKTHEKRVSGQNNVKHRRAEKIQPKDVLDEVPEKLEDFLKPKK